MKKRMGRIAAMGLALMLTLGAVAGCNSKGNDSSTKDTKSNASTTGGEAKDNSDAGDSQVAVSEWVIPVLSAETGAIAFVGKPASWAAQYAASVINEQGGINGVPIKVVTYDTKFDTAEAVSAMSQVVDDSLIVVGPMDAPGGQAAGQLAFDARVANIAAYSYADVRAEYSPYAISYMTDSEEGDWLAAQQWKKLNDDIKTVVIFTCPTDSSQMATTKLLEENLPSIGIEVLKVVEVETGTLDCGPAAIQAINAGADGYISVVRADENAKVVAELRARGVEEGRRITCGFSSYSSNYIDVVDAGALEGTYIWNKLDPSYNGAEWNTLVEAYKKDFDGAAPTSNPVPDFYNALMAIKQCYEELGITGDPAKYDEEKTAIAEWLYNSPVITGIQGDYQWVDGKKIAPVYYFQFDADKNPVAVSAE